MEFINFILFLYSYLRSPRIVGSGPSIDMPGGSEMSEALVVRRLELACGIEGNTALGEFVYGYSYDGIDGAAEEEVGPWAGCSEVFTTGLDVEN